MKHSTYITALLLLPWACVPDTGNYTYVDASTLDPATVSGINTGYTITMMDTLRVDPVLEEGARDEDHEYLWYVYSRTLDRDTIARERELTYPVTLLPALDYQLVLQVTNKRTGIYKYHRAALRVTTPFAEGWFITKDENQVTDIDFISPGGKIATNLLATANGQGVPGQAIKSAYANYITVIVPLEDGRDTIYKNHDALYVMTRSTIQLYDIENMNLMNTIDQLFMKQPDKFAPGDIICFNSAKVITNDNVAYVLDTRASAENIGKWGVITPGARIDPVNMCRSAVGGFLVFDPDARSLKQLNTYKGAYLPVNAAGTFPANNMDLDMVFMKEKAEQLRGGVAIMKQRGGNDLYGFTFNGLMAGVSGLWENPTSPVIMNPIATRVQVPPGSNIFDAALHGTHASMNVVYFSRGDNEVWYYNLSNGNEEKVLALPAGERVTYAQTVARYGPTTFHLAVLTASDGGWTLRAYDFQPSTALVEPRPFIEHSGQGYPRHVYYRSLSSTASF